MIGQEYLRYKLNSMLKHNNLPHFIIFVGPRGSGRTMLTKYIANKISAIYTISDIKVDSIREVIDTAYKSTDKIVYHIKDADTMRAEAKNAMLKITEEPPKNAYFVMTVENDASLLDTIMSRAFVEHMEPYTPDQLSEYAKSKYSQFDKIILDIAATPYQIDTLIHYGSEFIEYVKLVIDNIGEVESANAFKSGNKIAFKDDPDKYDLTVFLKTFTTLCTNKLTDGTYDNIWAEYAIITCIYVDKSAKLGVNKQQLYDMWVFDIREAYYEYNRP